MRVMAYRTYQYRIRTSVQGYDHLDEVLHMCKTLYNAALQERRDAYRMNRISRSYLDQQAQFTLIRRDLPEWKAISLLIGRGVLRRIDRAFQAFFHRIRLGEKPGYPRFQSHRRYSTIELAEVQPSMIRYGAKGRPFLKIKGLPNLHFQAKNIPDSKPKKLMLTKRPTGWVLSLTFELEANPLPETDRFVGIDMGVAKRLTLSDGTRIERRRTDNKREQRLRRSISRCSKGSSTRAKRVRSLGRETYRNQIRNRNQVHRITTDLVRRYDLIALENLRIGNMTRSVRGTEEFPGKSVKAKSGLNRSILDQTWGMMQSQLIYKAEDADREVVFVDPKYTSQTCSKCGLIEASNRTGEKYSCVCGMELDADVNAALNVLSRAQGAREYGEPSSLRPGGRTEKSTSRAARKVA